MSQIIEFIGGPLDGHRHSIAYSPQELSGTIEFPISPELLCVLTGEGERPLGIATSAAIYELQREGGFLTYRHIGSRATDEHPFGRR